MIGRSVVSDKVRNEEEPLYALHEYLLQAEKFLTVSMLTSGLAHDAGTPLMAISSLSRLLLEQAGDPTARQKAVAQIGESVDQLSQIIRNLVDLSRPIRLEKQKVYLNGLIAEALQIIKHDRRLKYRQVLTELMPQIPQIEANPDQLLQVILSLCLNAADALEKIPTGQLTLKTWADGQQVCFSVTDSGAGVDREDLPRLFTPFYTTKGENKGNGLGLYLSRTIITAHGGTIELASAPGEGTCVTIALPALAADRGEQ